MAEALDPTTPATEPVARPAIAIAIAWIALALAVTSLGGYIPLPGIKSEVIADLVAARPPGLFLPRGNAIARLSIFALGVTPYVSAFVLVYLAMAFSARLQALARDGARGSVIVRRWLLIGTLILAALQAYMVAGAIEGIDNLVRAPGTPFRLSCVLTMTAGTMLLVTLGQMIPCRGPLDGVWLMFAVGTLAEIAGAIAAVAQTEGAGRASEVLLLVALMVAAMIALIVLLDRAERRWPAGPQNPSSGAPSPVSLPAVPLRLGIVGVLAPVITPWLLSIPRLLARWLEPTGGGSLSTLATVLESSSLLSMLVYAVILLLTFLLLNALLFDPRGREVADASHEHDLTAPAPGEESPTRERAFVRLAVLPAVALVLICLAPWLLSFAIDVPIALDGLPLIAFVTSALGVLAALGLPALSNGVVAVPAKPQAP